MVARNRSFLMLPTGWSCSVVLLLLLSAQTALGACLGGAGANDGRVEDFYFDITSNANTIVITDIQWVAQRERGNVEIEVNHYGGSYLDGGSTTRVTERSIDDIDEGDYVNLHLDTYITIPPFSTRGIYIDTVSSSDSAMQYTYSSQAEGSYFYSAADINLGVGMGYDEDTGDEYQIEFNGLVCFNVESESGSTDPPTSSGCAGETGDNDGHAQDFYFDVSAGDDEFTVTHIEFLAERLRENIELEIYYYTGGSFLDGGSTSLVFDGEFDDIDEGDVVSVQLDTPIHVPAHSTRGIFLDIESSGDQVFQFTDSSDDEGDIHYSNGVINIHVGRAIDGSDTNNDVMFNGYICYTTSGGTTTTNDGPTTTQPAGTNPPGQETCPFYADYNSDGGGAEDLYFDIVAGATPLTVTNFVVIYTESRQDLDLEISVYPGSYLDGGSPTLLADLDLEDKDEGELDLELDLDVFIPAFSTRGFRFQVTTEGDSVIQFTTTSSYAEGQVYFTDGAMSLTAGRAEALPTLLLLTDEDPESHAPVLFNGAVCYKGHPPVEDPTNAPTPSPTRPPTRSPTKSPTAPPPTRSPTPTPTTPPPSEGPTPSPEPLDDAPCVGDLVYVDSLMTWRNARDYCRETLGGLLPSIHNAAREQEVRAVGAASGSMSYWIGINDYFNVGEHTWSDGTAVTYAINWGVNHPEAGQCGVFNNQPGDFWWDDFCGASHPSVCCIPPGDGDVTSAPPSETPTVSPTTAPPSEAPTASPTTAPPSEAPTVSPTTAPPSEAPTVSPTTAPPSEAPTVSPTTAPPSEAPTVSPTRAPPPAPTESPTPGPPVFMTEAPTPTPITGGELVYVNQTLNWDAALAHCNGLGGKFPSVHSLEEEIAVRDFAFSFSTTNNYWMGYRTDTQLITEWTDGTPFDYFNWGGNDPMENECGLWAAFDEQMFWWDASCVGNNRFICFISSD